MSDTQHTPKTPLPAIHPSVRERLLRFSTPRAQTVAARRDPPPVKRRRLVFKVARHQDQDKHDDHASDPRVESKVAVESVNHTSSRRTKRRRLSAGHRLRRRLRFGWREVDAMPAEEMFELVGERAREEGVRFVPAGSDLCGTVDEHDEDRVEDTYNDEEVNSEWFEEHCANCGMDREGDDEYDSEDEDRPRSELVLWCCQYCEGDVRD